MPPTYASIYRRLMQECDLKSASQLAGWLGIKKQSVSQHLTSNDPIKHSLATIIDKYNGDLNYLLRGVSQRADQHTPGSSSCDPAEIDSLKNRIRALEQKTHDLETENQALLKAFEHIGANPKPKPLTSDRKRHSVHT